MLMNIIMVHDDHKFIEEAARALGLAGHNVVTFGDPMEALTALENDRFEILITRVRFPPGRPNGVALAQMALLKRPAHCTNEPRDVEDRNYSGPPADDNQVNRAHSNGTSE